jgi:hypothetical protein
MIGFLILTLLFAPIGGASKKIDNPYKIVICMKKQTLYCYKDDIMFFETKISTGMGLGFFATPIGSFRVGNKAEVAYAEEWEVWVYHWMQFAGRNGMHSLQGMVYYKLLGRKASHGCVRLNHEAAKYLYSFIPVLTPVWVLEEFDPVMDVRQLTPRTRILVKPPVAKRMNLFPLMSHTPAAPHLTSLKSFFVDFGL